MSSLTFAPLGSLDFFFYGAEDEQCSLIWSSFSSTIVFLLLLFSSLLFEKDSLTFSGFFPSRVGPILCLLSLLLSRSELCPILWSLSFQNTTHNHSIRSEDLHDGITIPPLDSIFMQLNIPFSCHWNYIYVISFEQWRKKKTSKCLLFILAVSIIAAEFFSIFSPV